MTNIEIFKKAGEEGYAIGQFNVSTLEQLKAVVLAAKNLNAPVIVGTSESEKEYLGVKQTASLVSSFREELGINIILNLDHGKSMDSIKEAAEAGYNAVHFDGSKLSLEENIRKTKEVVDYVRNFYPSMTIEGEIGFLKGSSTLHDDLIKIKESELTSPEEAELFVKETKVDNLAVIIGNVHGIYKEMPNLDLERLAEIKKIFSGGIVLHGGSGIAEDQIRAAIGGGVVKININTELRLLFRQNLERSLREKPEELKPYEIMSPIVVAIKEAVEDKIRLFGGENKA